MLHVFASAGSTSVVCRHHEVWDAIGTEKKIKGWSHDKKTALINGDFKALKELSHSRISASHPSTSSG